MLRKLPTGNYHSHYTHKSTPPCHPPTPEPFMHNKEGGRSLHFMSLLTYNMDLFQSSR